MLPAGLPVGYKPRWKPIVPGCHPTLEVTRGSQPQGRRCQRVRMDSWSTAPEIICQSSFQSLRATGLCTDPQTVAVDAGALHPVIAQHTGYFLV